MSVARSSLGSESESEDQTWNDEEEYQEDTEDDDDIEETENQTSDDTWDDDELEVDEESNTNERPEFGKASEFYPAVVEPVQDGVNLERSGSYGKPPITTLPRRSVSRTTPQTLSTF
ncbi:hypothetical protein H4Q26_008874 [Puccinia striiformis f. sp. tritici PST-130]|nr:hypothetical protein H4Q26_008874 [Puccinia striiformis f. sp. tritici PST-130]